MTTLLAIRLRGSCSVNEKIEDTMQMLGLKRRYSAIVVETNDVVNGMLRKVESFITWGEPNVETLASINKLNPKKTGFSIFVGLKPPVGGLRAIKLGWPKGDLGNRADKINDLVKRMI